MLESLFDKAAGLNACKSIKKRVQHRFSPVKFAKFLRTPFFYRRVPGKEFGAKVGVTINNKYQIQLRKSICRRESLEAATVDVL